MAATMAVMLALVAVIDPARQSSLGHPDPDVSLNRIVPAWPAGLSVMATQASILFDLDVSYKAVVNLENQFMTIRTVKAEDCCRQVIEPVTQCTIGSLDKDPKPEGNVRQFADFTCSREAIRECANKWLVKKKIALSVEPQSNPPATSYTVKLKALMTDCPAAKSPNRPTDVGVVTVTLDAAGSPPM
jgi:hypothetical protein